MTPDGTVGVGCHGGEVSTAFDNEAEIAHPSPRIELTNVSRA